MDDTKPMEVAEDPHAACQQQIVELEAKWKRAVADYANREKDIAREREEFAQWATADLIRDFLPIVDAIEAGSRKPEAESTEAADGSDASGYRLSAIGYAQLHRLCLDLFKRHGVEPVGAVGDRVDYLLHEVVGTKQVPKDFSPSHRDGSPPAQGGARGGGNGEREGVVQEKNVPGTILEVVQVGYTMHGRLLRPAKVIIQGEMTNDEARMTNQ